MNPEYRRRRFRRLTLCGLLALCAGACASTWAPRASQPEQPLQWPLLPHRAKLTYSHALSGFEPARGAGSALRSLAIGRAGRGEYEFVLPVAVATGSDGRIAVADLGRRSVDLYLPAERRVLRLSGSRDQRLVSPVALAFDDRSRLWVSDSAGRIFAFEPAGELALVLDSIGAEALLRPTGIAWSPTRQLLYVVDTLANRIHAFDRDGRHRSSFGGRGEQEGLLNFPTHLFRAPTGELYVTDAMNFRVAIFDEDGRPRGAFGRHGDGSGDLAMPKGVAVDRDGVVYVADGRFDNIQLFDRSGAYLLTVGSRGTGFGELWLPAGLFISSTGELMICDTYNRRIQVFRISEAYEAPGD